VERRAFFFFPESLGQLEGRLNPPSIPFFSPLPPPPGFSLQRVQTHKERRVSSFFLFTFPFFSSCEAFESVVGEGGEGGKEGQASVRLFPFFFPFPFLLVFSPFFFSPR